MASGAVIYDGPSEIDGARIVAIALTDVATNRKTGNMVQTYILRPDLDPVSAVHQGLDGSICGTCPHRGDGTGKARSCYITLIHGPSVVYRTFRAGGYSDLGSSPLPVLASLGQGRQVRLGTYGDPAAVPTRVWAALISQAAGWTGYTHMWRTRSQLAASVMASVDSPAEYATANANGWRTFRVRTADQPLLPGEIACPASAEAGKRAQCATCGLCKGTARPAKNIAIIAHGNSGQYNMVASRFGG
jgi:hypothetical protein